MNRLTSTVFLASTNDSWTESLISESITHICQSARSKTDGGERIFLKPTTLFLRTGFDATKRGITMHKSITEVYTRIHSKEAFVVAETPLEKILRWRMCATIFHSLVNIGKRVKDQLTSTSGRSSPTTCVGVPSNRRIFVRWLPSPHWGKLSFGYIWFWRMCCVWYQDDIYIYFDIT